jgi:hypothetical protein
LDHTLEKEVRKDPRMTQNDHFWSHFEGLFEPILPNTNEIGGTFEIMAQKDLPNDPKMTILEDPFRTTYYQTPTKPGELLK